MPKEHNTKPAWSNPDYAMMLHSVDVELSGDCSANCVFCPRDKIMREKTSMSQTVFRSLIKQISVIRPEGPRAIFFCGLGEPFLNNNIFQFADHAKSIFPKTHIVIVTNGSSLNQVTCDALLSSGIHWFSCSMQAIKKDQYESCMRGLNFESVMHWLNYLAERKNEVGLNVSVSYVKTNQTTREIEEYYQFWNNIGVPVGENRIHSRGGFLAKESNATHFRKNCLLFNSRTFIAANGDILACCNDLEGITCLGNISSDPIKTVLDTKLRMILEKRLFSICSKCNDESAFTSFPRVVETAFQHHQSGRFAEAEDLYRKVLKIDPDNYDSTHLLGALLHQLGEYENALELLIRAVQMHEEDPFANNNLGVVYKKLGRLSEAENSFRSALISKPDFAGAYGNLGGVLSDLGRLDEAEAAFRKSLLLEPESADTWHDLANLLHETGQSFEAKIAYLQAIAFRPDFSEAYLNLGRLLRDFEQIEEAVQACQQAITISPELAEAHCILGVMLHKIGRADEAEAAFKQALFLQPDNAAVYCDLGETLRFQGRHDEAENACRMAIAIDHSFAEAYFNLGNVLCESKRLEEAESAYRQALTIMPEFAVAYCNLGIVLFELGRFDESEVAYQNALGIDPILVEVYCNISNLYRERGCLYEAEEACQEALLIMPDYADALNNLSVVLLDLGRPVEAEDLCHRAIEIKPDFAEAHCSLGNVLCELERLKEAEDAYRRSLECKPEYAEAYSNLGNALKEMGRYEEAKVAFLQALELKPSLHACRIKIAMLSLPLIVTSDYEAGAVAVQFSRSLDELDAAARLFGASELGKEVGALQPFNLAYRLGDHSQLLSRYGDFICTARAAWLEKNSNFVMPFLSQGRQRVRLLIVTGQIRRHSVWDVMLHGLLRYLDQNIFEIVVYHTISKEDEETVRARSIVDRFVQGPADWLKHVYEDSPDIIFYPEIGMDAATLKLAAIRLAPLQVASWGHPITTGLSTIDLFFSGELLEREDADTDYRERLVRLPGTGACSVLMPYDAKDPDSNKVDLPLNRNIIRFLICQQAIKFDPAFDEIYSRIARKAGLCCFYFVRDRKFGWASDIVERRIIKTFEDAGIAPEAYIRFVDWLPGDQFWGFMDVMDIYLDIPSFSGYTTAWQAIHRGLPVVTYEGPHMRQRLAAGLLRKIGVTETIASDIEEYISIASALAMSPVQRASLRNLLCTRAPTANEDVSVVRAFETILLGEYNKLCRGCAC